MTDWLDWIRAHQTAMWWLAAASALMFVVSLLLVPVIVARIPADYFSQKKRPQTPWSSRHLVIRALMLFVKNTLGILLVVSGIAMLILPGQGIISMVAGIVLLDFPGKFRLERWLVSRGPVLRTINWLREQMNQEPLILDE